MTRQSVAQGDRGAEPAELPSKSATVIVAMGDGQAGRDERESHAT